MARNYSNTAFDTALVGTITAGALSLAVADATGYPSPPFAIVVNPGSLTTEEVMQVTAVVGTTFTVTRGFDGTVAAAHNSGEVVRHAAIAGDFTDLQAADTTEATARAAADAAHASLTTTAHGGIGPIAGSQSANLVFAGPAAGIAATPTFRALVAADIPTIAQSQVTNLVSDLAGKAPTSRTLTINGVAFDLSADRSWTIAAGGTVGGTGTAGRITQWASGGANIEDSTLIKSGAGVLTLAGGVTQTWRGDSAGNIGLGQNSFNALTSGARNVGIGMSTLFLLQSGNENFALGEEALAGVVSGSSNVAIGYQSLKASTASNNTAIGARAGQSTTSGSESVYVGDSAGLQITTGFQNVFIGNAAGRGTAGSRSRNVIIGYVAGFALAGSNNVMIGYSAGSAETGSNKLYIESSSDARPLIYGDFSADTLTFYADPSSTNTVLTQLTLDRGSSGTPANGMGNALLFALESSTTAAQGAAVWSALWATATHASRKARVVGEVYDTAAREWIRGEADGSAAMVGFLGASAVARQTSGANLTNNVTSGGTDNQIDNWTDLTTYATDAAAIRNAVYQLSRKLKQCNDALRLYGLLT